MEIEENREFIRKIEALVKPEDVTAISFLGDFNKILPVKSQKKVMSKGNRDIPYMGFIVDPYCFFASFEIKDIPAAQKMLPPDYELLETALFTEEEKRHALIVSVFTARTSAFTGMRMEFYLIAKHKTDGKAAWIIVDYATNTNSYDPARGFSGYNSDPAIFTTTPYGELLLDIGSKGEGRRLSLRADITKGAYRELDYTLWVEGNMSVDYGGVLRAEGSSVFSLIFDPVLMSRSLQIPSESVEIIENSYFSGLIHAESPLSYACFPYGQHYIIKQDLRQGEIRTEKDLEEKAAEFVSAKGYKIMRGKDLKKPIIIGMIVSAVLNYGIIIFLLFKLFS